jgi:hypothetical protein
MDVHQFKWMAFGVVRIDDGIALIKRVETEGTPQLCKWLRECGHDWMMNEKIAAAACGLWRLRC